LFWVEDQSVQPVPVRDIYKLEFDLFQSGGWCFFYIFCTFIFLLHGFWGWEKLTGATSFNIPKAQQSKVVFMGEENLFSWVNAWSSAEQGGVYG
jgi:hypothetical protein